MNIAIDTEAALNRMDGDLEFLHELLEIFADELSILVPAIRAAIDRQDGTALAAAAHTLKGAAASVAANAVAEAAYQLEQMGRTRDFRSTDSVLASLDMAIDGQRCTHNAGIGCAGRSCCPRSDA